MVETRASAINRQNQVGIDKVPRKPVGPSGGVASQAPGPTPYTIDPDPFRNQAGLPGSTVKPSEIMQEVKQNAIASAPAPAPATDLYSYEDMKFGYDPKLMADPERLYAPSLGRQRYQADAGVNSGAQSGYLTGASNLASTSGLSLADKKALQQQSQRQKVLGSQAAQSPFLQMEAQNLYDTDQFNIQNKQKIAAANQAILNQYEQDKAEFEQHKAEVIYEQKKAEARLQQALEGAAKSAY